MKLGILEVVLILFVVVLPLLVVLLVVRLAGKKNSARGPGVNTSVFKDTNDGTDKP